MIHFLVLTWFGFTFTSTGSRDGRSTEASRRSQRTWPEGQGKIEKCPKPRRTKRQGGVTGIPGLHDETSCVCTCRTDTIIAAVHHVCVYVQFSILDQCIMKACKLSSLHGTMLRIDDRPLIYGAVVGKQRSRLINLNIIISQYKLSVYTDRWIILTW